MCGWLPASPHAQLRSPAEQARRATAARHGRVEREQHDVGGEVQEDDRGRGDERHGEDHRQVVALEARERPDHRAPEPGEAEDRLDVHRDPDRHRGFVQHHAVGVAGRDMVVTLVTLRHHAEKHHAARHALQDVGEVFGPHQRPRAVAVVVGAHEGARHGAWFDTASRTNIFLDDSDVMSAVSSGLNGSGIICTGVNGINCFVPSATCLAPTDSNTLNNKPYAASAYPATTQQANVYICYAQPGNGPRVGTLGAHPTDNSWRLGDINVSLLMNFALITPFIQNLFGTGINMAFNEHFTIQGKP